MMKMFDKINHSYLKQKLCHVLSVEKLPNDYFAIFRNITCFSSWDWEKIISKDERCEEVLKEHLYYSMKRMRHQIDVEYRDYFEEEPDEGKFDI